MVRGEANHDGLNSTACILHKVELQQQQPQGKEITAAAAAAVAVAVAAASPSSNGSTVRGQHKTPRSNSLIFTWLRNE
jgi:hypothetical protein